MQIFCDESGGADPANEIFLVAAIALPTAVATRLIKSFRKAVRWKEIEIKGHLLTPEHRRIFFDLLQKSDIGSVVVSCSRRDAVGGWAMGALSESAIYGHLLREACLGLIVSGSDALTITPDGGRYKRTDLNRVAADLTEAIRNRASPVQRVTVGFENSSLLPGLQIADVIANSVFQAMKGTTAWGVESPLLMPLRQSGRLTLRGVELENVRPEWLVR